MRWQAAVVVLLVCVGFKIKANTMRVDWHCPHHIANSPVPQQKQITVELDQEGNLHSPALQQIIQRAHQQHGKRYNFYRCVSDFMGSPILYEERAKKLYQTTDKSSRNKIADNFNLSQLKILDTARQDLKGPQSLLVPGLSLGQSLSDKASNKIFDDFVYGLAHHPEALSQEALKNILPEAIKYIHQHNTHVEARNMFKKLIHSLTAEFYQQSQGWSDHPQAALSKQAFQKVRALVPYNLTIHEEGVLCPDSWQPSVRQLRHLAQALQKIPRCVNLLPGDSQQIPPRRTGNGYLLRLLNNKNGKSVYEAALALRFDVNSSLTPEQKSEELQNMRQATTQCFKKYGDKFKDPISGGQLKFNIAYVASVGEQLGRVPADKKNKVIEKFENSQLTKKVGGSYRSIQPTVRHAGAVMPVSDIRIVMDAAHRTNSVKWAPDIDCGVIIHEVLHHLGLADEYKETMAAATLPAHQRKGPYHCRSVGPKNSIMHLHNEALKAIEAEELARTCEIQVEQTTKCLRARQIVQDRQHRDSLLYPAHFLLIVHPGCSLSTTYDQCTAQAYTTGLSPQDAKNKQVCIKAANPKCAKLWGPQPLLAPWTAPSP